MTLLVDIDASVKLAHWGLLAELPNLLGFCWQECATLTSLKFRAQRAATKPDGRLFHSVEAAQAVIEVCAHLSALPADTALLPAFQDIPGIDAGEAVLISTVSASTQSRLLTGDKRCLRALAQLPINDRVALEGKCVLVEQVVLLALDKHGLAWLREKICSFRHIDKSILVAMGSRCDAGEASVREALTSYIDEIATACDPSLLAAL